MGNIKPTTKCNSKPWKYRSEKLKRWVMHRVFKRMEIYGESARKASSFWGLPISTFSDWVDYFGLTDQYAKANELMANARVDQINDLLQKDLPFDVDGKRDAVILKQRQAIAGMMQWELSKVTKRYSDRKSVEMSGEMTTKTQIIPSFGDR